MKLRPNGAVGWLPVFLGGLLIMSAATACDDDDDGPSAEDLREVEDIVRQGFQSTGETAEFFFAHVTDNLLATVFFASREECMAAPNECIGEPSAVESISRTTIDGETATTEVAADFGTFTVGLLREDDTWKLDSLQPVSDEVPASVAKVPLVLTEFGFGFDPGDIPSSGNFAFEVNNAGEQAHEVVVVPMLPGAGVEESLEPVLAEETPPLALKVFIAPGQKLDLAFDEPLEPGEYILVCFFPDIEDPEFTAHVEKGMVSTFTVE